MKTPPPPPPPSRNQRILFLLSRVSALISIISFLTWLHLLTMIYTSLSKKEFYSILILMGNDLFRIGLSIVEYSTDRYLFLRAIPMVLQVILGKRSVIQKLVDPRKQQLESWLRLLQAIYYSNLCIDILFTLFAGLYMLDSKIIFMTFLEVLLV